MSKRTKKTGERIVIGTLDYIHSKGFDLFEEIGRKGHHHTEKYRIIGQKSLNLVGIYDRKKKVARISYNRTPGFCPTMMEVQKLVNACKREFIEYKFFNRL